MHAGWRSWSLSFSKWNSGLELTTPTLTPCLGVHALMTAADTVKRGKLGPRHDTDGPACRVTQVVSPPEWRAQQEQDADLHPVLHWVEPKTKVVGGHWVLTCSRMKCSRESGKSQLPIAERWQVVVPRALRDPVLKSCHGTTGAGHFDVSKTLCRLRQGFYWGQLRRDVEDFYCRCELCAGPLDQSHAQLQQLAVGAPMERVVMDIMGP